MSDDPSKEATGFPMAQPSPLLADPDWIIGFRSMVDQLLNAGHAATRHASMSSYRTAVLETRWKPWLDGLSCHVYRVVEDGRNGPLVRTYACDSDIEEAYQLACAALDEAADVAGPTEAMMAALEDIADRLSRWEPAASTAPSPGEGGQAGPARQAEGTIMSVDPTRINAPAPETTELELDEPDDEPFPDPATIGGLRRLVWEMDQIHAAAGSSAGTRDGKYTPVTRRAANRRYVAMVQAPGYKALETYLNTQLGQYVTTKALDDVAGCLARALQQRFEVVDRLSLVEALEILTRPPAPREGGQASPSAAGSKAMMPGDPAARAVAAAYSLRKAGKPVSVRAACAAARVDRKNLAAKYPEAIKIIEQLAEPDRSPPKGGTDRRTGNRDAWDESDDD